MTIPCDMCGKEIELSEINIGCFDPLTGRELILCDEDFSLNELHINLAKVLIF